MEPRRRVLRLYTQPSAHPPLAWDWVSAQLESAGTYWVLARTPGHPHPRPVWGVWQESLLHLSIGSPVLNAALSADPRVTVHLDSGTEVIIVEGAVEGEVEGAVAGAGHPFDRGPIEAYNAKYDWDYDAAQYGRLKTVAPSRVLAWRTAGPAGRESFTTTGSWEWEGRRQLP